MIHFQQLQSTSSGRPRLSEPDSHSLLLCMTLGIAQQPCNHSPHVCAWLTNPVVSDSFACIHAAVQQHHKAAPQQEAGNESPRGAQQPAASPHARGAQGRPVALETPKDQYNRHLEAARSRSGTLSGNLGHRVQSPKAAVLANGEALGCDALSVSVLRACASNTLLLAELLYMEVLHSSALGSLDQRGLHPTLSRWPMITQLLDIMQMQHWPCSNPECLQFTCCGKTLRHDCCLFPSTDPVVVL